MAYIMIRIEVPAMDDTQLNEKVFSGPAGDSTKAHEGVNALRNMMDAINGGAIDAQVDVAVRDSSEAINAAGDGSSASWNLK